MLSVYIKLYNKPHSSQLAYSSVLGGEARRSMRLDRIRNKALSSQPESALGTVLGVVRSVANGETGGGHPKESLTFPDINSYVIVISPINVAERA